MKARRQAVRGSRVLHRNIQDIRIHSCLVRTFSRQNDAQKPLETGGDSVANAYHGRDPEVQRIVRDLLHVRVVAGEEDVVL